MLQWWILGLLVAMLIYELYALKTGKPLITTMTRRFTWKEPGFATASAFFLALILGAIIGHVWLTPTCN